jgi:PKHD-type hydroxylase
MIRSDGDRSMLFELDQTIQKLALDLPGSPNGVKLTGIYHNLLRRWAEM